MPLIAPRSRGRRATVKVELDGETRRLLRLYEKYSNNDSDRIVEGALAMLFAQDAEFSPWVARHGEENGEGGGLRSRKTPDTHDVAAGEQA